MTYDVESYSFLRHSDNARNDHPTDRPFYLSIFGGRDKLSATQDLLSQYRNPATSQWDWPSLMKSYSRFYIGAITTPKFKQQFSGVFTAVDSTGYTIITGPAEPLRAPKEAVHNSIAAPSDMSDVADKMKNLRFTLKKPQAKPSAISPF